MIYILLSSGINNPPGGIDQFCLFIKDILTKRNIAYKLIYVGDENNDTNSLTLKVTRRPLSLWYSAAILKEFFWGQLKISHQDIVIANRPEIAAVLFPLLPKKCKKIMFVHGSSAYASLFWSKIPSYIHLLCERIAIRFSSATAILLRNSEYGLPYYKRTYPKYASKLSYCGLPVSSVFQRTSHYAKARSNSMTLTFGYHGRIINNPKRVEDYLHVAKQLMTDGYDIKLVLIGGGEDEGLIKSRAIELGIKSHIEMTGPLNGDSLRQKLLTFDAYLLLSRFEGICLSTLEAASIGIPVVATTVGDIPHYIRNNRNGLLISPTYSIDEVCNALIKAKELITQDVDSLNEYSMPAFEQSITALITEAPSPEPNFSQKK